MVNNSTNKSKASKHLSPNKDNIISSKYNLFSPWYSWKNAHLALSNNFTRSLFGPLKEDWTIRIFTWKYTDV
jgi:hypothetical protein